MFFKEFYDEQLPNYVKHGIPFGQFTVQSVDKQLISSYMQSRKVKPNTLLGELSTISGAFTHAYMYFTEFEDGIENPVKRLPRGEKPKPDSNRKTVINEEQTLKIAEYLGLKANKIPTNALFNASIPAAGRVKPYQCFGRTSTGRSRPYLFRRPRIGIQEKFLLSPTSLSTFSRIRKPMARSSV